MTESAGSTANTLGFDPFVGNLTAVEEDESIIVEEMVKELMKQVEYETSFPPPNSMQEYSSPSPSLLPLSSASSIAAMTIKGIKENSELPISILESSNTTTPTNMAVEIDIAGPNQYLREMMGGLPSTIEWTMDEDDLYWQLGDLPGAADVNKTYDKWLTGDLTDLSFEK